MSLRAGYRGLPVAVQVGLLLMLSLVAAQAMGVAVVILTPPPPLPVYSMSEVAGALRGGPLEATMGPKLTRTIEASAPVAADLRGFRDSFVRRQLATLLQVPETKVRFQGQRRPGGPIRIILHQTLTPSMSGPPPNAFFGRLPGPPPGSPPPPGMAMRMYRMGGAVIGGFVATEQRTDGRWTVVRSPREPFFSAWHQRVALWFLGCLVIVAVAAWLFARRITAPIDRFAKAAQALGRDPHAPPMNLKGPAEIGEAAAAFNDMQARIRRYVDDRTAMVGAISHDLRTPLARIRYKLESAPEPLKARIQRDVEQMEEMIGQVLAFIRDASEPRRRERLDLLSLIEVVADEAVLAGAEVELTDAHPAIVEGDLLALQRMLTNLVDNADKYGRRARISLTEANGEAVVRIEDDGPGLPDGELERVFQPFYRPDAARTLDDGGVGLGLSVARSIARAHGGDIVLETLPQGGLAASVKLPLAG